MRHLPHADGGGIERDFTQDACSYWSVTLQCAVDAPGVPLDAAEIGMDRGLTYQRTCADMAAPYSRTNLTRRPGAALAMAQRAHKITRVKAIHARIAHTRKDWTRKTTTAMVQRARLIVVGNVSSSKLSNTRMAQSVLHGGQHATTCAAPICVHTGSYALSHPYFMAYGLIGVPTALVTGKGGATIRNS